MKITSPHKGNLLPFSLWNASLLLFTPKVELKIFNYAPISALKYSLWPDSSIKTTTYFSTAPNAAPNSLRPSQFSLELSPQERKIALWFPEDPRKRFLAWPNPRLLRRQSNTRLFYGENYLFIKRATTYNYERL